MHPDLIISLLKLPLIGGVEASFCLNPAHYHHYTREKLKFEEEPARENLWTT